MSYNWKEAEFKISKKTELIQKLKVDKEHLIKSLRALQRACIDNDAGSVIDSDAFHESRQLLHKFNMEIKRNT